MEWVYILIVLVPLLVWVLSTIFRGAEEANAPVRRPPAADGAPQAVPRRPTNDLDRFLQDAQRRREKAAARKKAEADEEAPPLLDLTPPAPPPPPPAPKAPEPRPRKEEPKPRRERPAERTPMRLAPPPAPAESGPPPPAPARRPPPAPASPSRAVPAAPVLARLAGLLRDRNALAAGLMLREVLDRPLCQRRGRR